VFYSHAQYLPNFSAIEYGQVVQRVHQTYFGDDAQGQLILLDQVVDSLLGHTLAKARQALGTTGRFPFLTGFPTIPGFYRKSTLEYLGITIATAPLLEYHAARFRLAHTLVLFSPPPVREKLGSNVIARVFHGKSGQGVVTQILQQATSQFSSTLRNIGKRIKFFFFAERACLHAWLLKDSISPLLLTSPENQAPLLTLRTSLHLVGSSIPGDVKAVEALLQTQIFDPSVLTAMASPYLEGKVKLPEERGPLLTALFGHLPPGVDSSRALLEEVCGELREHFVMTFCSSKTKRDADAVLPVGPSAVTTLALDMFDPLCYLPDSLEWPFSPIVELFAFHVVNKRPIEEEPEVLEHHLLQAVRFVTLLEALLPEVMGGLPAGTKITVLMQLYLLDTQAFLDPQMRALLRALLTLYTRSRHPHDFNPFSTVEGVALAPEYSRFRTVIFSELFKEFVRQFASESFGDETFARFLVLQMQTAVPRESRLMVWNDEAEVLRLITLPPEEVPAPGGLGGYLYPVEVSSVLLGAYAHALIGERVVKKRNPFVYWYAVHHLSGYVFRDEVEIRPAKDAKEEALHHKDLLRTLVMSLPPDVSRDLLLYHNTPLSASVLVPPICYTRLEFRIQQRAPALLATFENEPTTLAKVRTILGSLPDR